MSADAVPARRPPRRVVPTLIAGPPDGDAHAHAPSLAAAPAAVGAAGAAGRAGDAVAPLVAGPSPLAAAPAAAPAQLDVGKRLSVILESTTVRLSAVVACSSERARIR
jgi:hypothetical protein